MINNGSPEPIVYTDEESILFLTTLPAHPLSLEKESIIVTKQVSNEVTKEVSNEVTKQTEDVGPFAEQILFFLEEMPLSKKILNFRY
ncbi:hypothetical protein AGMMS49525_14670 [Bacteroidia bacterium]|nr:hypothetical protein AGMMS49525_14670 [Bacteroidia bacterium]